MEIHDSRRQSFNKSKSRSKNAHKGWPHPKSFVANPENLANAGFFFKPTKEEPDNVQCFCCRKELAGWDADDNPFEVHYDKSPTCPWAIARCSIEFDVDARGKFVFRDESRLPSNKILEKARLNTYDNKWPYDTTKGHGATSKRMASAGFVYTPQVPGDDTATCFYCELTLSGWDDDDDPEEEHHKREKKSGKPCAFFQKEPIAPLKEVKSDANKATRKSRAPKMVQGSLEPDDDVQEVQKPAAGKSAGRKPSISLALSGDEGDNSEDLREDDDPSLKVQNQPAPKSKRTTKKSKATEEKRTDAEDTEGGTGEVKKVRRKGQTGKKTKDVETTDTPPSPVDGKPVSKYKDFEIGLDEVEETRKSRPKAKASGSRKSQSRSKSKSKGRSTRASSRAPSSDVESHAPSRASSRPRVSEVAEVSDEEMHGDDAPLPTPPSPKAAPKSKSKSKKSKAPPSEEMERLTVADDDEPPNEPVARSGKKVAVYPMEEDDESRNLPPAEVEPAPEKPNPKPKKKTTKASKERKEASQSDRSESRSRTTTAESRSRTATTSSHADSMDVDKQAGQAQGSSALKGIPSPLTAIAAEESRRNFQPLVKSNSERQVESILFSQQNRQRLDSAASGTKQKKPTSSLSQSQSRHRASPSPSPVEREERFPSPTPSPVEFNHNALDVNMDVDDNPFNPPPQPAHNVDDDSEKENHQTTQIRQPAPPTPMANTGPFKPKSTKPRPKPQPNFNSSTAIPAPSTPERQIFRTFPQAQAKRLPSLQPPPLAPSPHIHSPNQPSPSPEPIPEQQTTETPNSPEPEPEPNHERSPSPPFYPPLSSTPLIHATQLTQEERELTVEQWVRKEMEVQCRKLREDAEVRIGVLKRKAEEVRRTIEAL